jgi:hypothetical protein
VKKAGFFKRFGHTILVSILKEMQAQKESASLQRCIVMAVQTNQVDPSMLSTIGYNNIMHEVLQAASRCT